MKFPSARIVAFAGMALIVLSACSKRKKESKLTIHSEVIRAESVSFRGTSFDVVKVNHGEVNLGLYWKNKSGKRYGSIGDLKSSLKDEGKDLLFATNAGIFSQNYNPGGLHIEHGTVLHDLNTKHGEGNFHLMPNGVFMVSQSGAAVIKTDTYTELTQSANLATQSGPMLVIEDELHPAFNEGSNNTYIRNGVGVTSHGEVCFVISKTPVNFFDFASLFRDKLQCPNALYLDGAISRMYCPDLGRYDTGGDFTGIIAITKDSGPKGHEAGAPLVQNP